MTRLPCLCAPLALLLATCAAPTPPTVEFTLLQANVGNAQLSCGDDYVYKLCDFDVEGRIAAQIAQLAPDVIVLQEVVPDALCDGFVEDDPTRVCHPDHRATEPSQVRRLLGDGYDVVCDDRNGYECIGVRHDGPVRAKTPYVTAPVVVDDDGVACDPGFSVGSLVLAVAGNLVVVVDGHPNSTLPSCRAAQVRQIFENVDDDGVGLVGGDEQQAIVSGDMNLDPFNAGLNETDESVDVWRTHVHEPDVDAADFVYASGPTERRPPWPTSTTLLDQVLDHVAVRGLRGSCVTLGEAEGTTRLDGGAGCDHRALSCSLSIAERTLTE